MKVIEQFYEGKTGDNKICEDKIVITDDFIAVLDGVTSRSGYSLGGVSTGCFATDAVAKGIAKLPDSIDAYAAVEALTAILKSDGEKAAAAEGKTFTDRWSRPATALIMYSKARQEVWRVADSTALIDGKAHMRFFPQEKIWCDLRHVHICALMAKGVSEQEIRDKDPAWDLLVPLIAETFVFANYDGPYGFGVLNGMPVPKTHVEIFPAAGAHEIVLASDGYTDVFPTLAETEKFLKDLLVEDPLMYKIRPQAKGPKKGWVSYDDRSYIRFQP